MNNDDKIELLEKHRENRARVACLERKVDAARDKLEALVADLRQNRVTIVDVRDGGLYTSNNHLIPPTMISELSETIAELRQATMDEAGTQDQVNRLGYG